MNSLRGAFRRARSERVSCVIRHSPSNPTFFFFFCSRRCDVPGDEAPWCPGSDAVTSRDGRRLGPDGLGQHRDRPRRVPRPVPSCLQVRRKGKWGLFDFSYCSARKGRRARLVLHTMMSSRACSTDPLSSPLPPPPPHDVDLRWLYRATSGFSIRTEAVLSSWTRSLNFARCGLVVDIEVVVRDAGSDTLSEAQVVIVNPMTLSAVHARM